MDSVEYPEDVPLLARQRPALLDPIDFADIAAGQRLQWRLTPEPFAVSLDPHIDRS